MLARDAASFWRGKRGSRRHSTTSFIASVVVAGTSYQMLEVLAFCNLERAQPPSITITVLTFLVKKVQWRIPGCLFIDNTRKNLKSNLVLVVVLVLESKGLYFIHLNYPRFFVKILVKEVMWLLTLTTPPRGRISACLFRRSESSGCVAVELNWTGFSFFGSLFGSCLLSCSPSPVSLVDPCSNACTLEIMLGL